MVAKKRVNCAVIGAGGIGLHHIRGLQQHRAARVVALADTSATRAAEACAQFGVPESTADYRELLRRPDIDAVSVALPNYLHARVGLDVLKAGKHLMMDKPLATKAADAARLIEEAKRRHVVFMVGQNQRFAPVRQALKRRIAAGELGDIYHAEAFWMRRSGIPRIGSWFTQKRYAGGGCTYDIGVHMLDLCLHLVGDFDAAAVSGQVSTRFGQRGLGNGGWGKSEIDPGAPFDVDDFAVAVIKMKSGRTVILRTSWAAHMPVGDANNVILYGTDGGAQVQPAQIFRPGRKAYRVEDVKPGRPLVAPDRMVHFVDVILGKAEPFVKPEESLKVQRILDAIYASSATGKEVRIR